MFRKTIGGQMSFASDTTLQLWLRADNVELTDGKVSRWYDLSPNQYEIVQTDTAAMPAVAENALNGHPSVAFNGTSTFLTGGDILDLGTDSWTWFVVGQYNNGNAQANYTPIFLAKYDRNIDWGAKPMWRLGRETGILFWKSGQTYIELSSNHTDNGFSIFGYELFDRNSSSNSLYKNNLLIGKNVYNGVFGNIDNNIPFKIGGDVYISTAVPSKNWLNGQIAEIIAFKTIDTDMRNKVYNYLAEKYFPEFTEPIVSLGLDIRVPYGFADTAITTAYRPDFTSYLWSTGAL